MKITVEIEDHGQDFLEWDIENHKVVGCRPCQSWIWVGTLVTNKRIRKGSILRLIIKGGEEIIDLKYPVVAVRKAVPA